MNNKQQIQSELSMLDLYRSINNGTATAETFEYAIKLNGLTMEIIKLISSYYATDIKEVA